MSRFKDLHKPFWCILCNAKHGETLFFVMLNHDKNAETSAFPTAACGDSLDWKDLETKDIVTRVTKRVKPGSVMLFHNGAKNTPAALPQVIEKLQAEGYQFVKATELLLPEPTTINHQGTQMPAEKPEEPSEQ